MPREIDEDLIEATIRRVAESKARLHDASPASDGGPVPDVLREREDEPELASQPEPDDAPEPEPIAPAEVAPEPVVAARIDEDAIEATIRRVAEEKAAREAEAASPAGANTSDGADASDGAIDEEEEPKSLEELRFDDESSGPRRFSAASAAGGIARSPWAPLQPVDDDELADEETAGAASIEDEPTPAAATSHPSPRSQPAVAALPHDSIAEDAPASLAEINAKLDRIIALLEGQGASAPPIVERPSAGRLVNFGASPRMTFRDTRAATAEQRDERPLPPPPAPVQAEPKRGLELLPRTYRITVEDKRRGVDLVPLHRALLGMDNVKDMSLLSYNNGIAIVALDTSGDIEPDNLRAAVSRAMARDAKVEVHNENTMVVKLAEE